MLTNNIVGLVTYQGFYTAAWNIFTDDPKLSLYFHDIKDLVDVRRSRDSLENLGLMHEFFDAFIPEFCVRSDVHGICVHDLNGVLLLGDFVNTIKDVSVERVTGNSQGSSKMAVKELRILLYYTKIDGSDLAAWELVQKCKGHFSV